MCKISLCMIVKNEEANLNRCLSNAAKYMDEIIVVDTGSTDRTKEIAWKYTDKVYDFVWTDDFSAARNYSIRQASNEYIFVLDGDEFLQSLDIEELKGLIVSHPEKIGRILRINEYTRGNHLYRYQERVNRLFSKKWYYYQGMIHEQVTPINERKEERSYDIPAIVLHTGYEGDVSVRKIKAERNIRLLLEAQRQQPEDPYLLYQLGKSYYMEENYIAACNYLSQALYFDLDPRLEYVQDMVESYGYSLLNSEQYKAAQQLLNVYDEFSCSADFLFLAGLIQMNNGKFREAITEFEKATNKSSGKMEGVNGYLSYYNIAVIYECLGEEKEAEKYYKKCGKYAPAEQRIQNLGRE